MGERFINALRANQSIIGPNVSSNLFEYHLKPIFD
jgi:hypothetical protein